MSPVLQYTSGTCCCVWFSNRSHMVSLTSTRLSLQRGSMTRTWTRLPRKSVLFMSKEPIYANYIYIDTVCVFIHLSWKHVYTYIHVWFNNTIYICHMYINCKPTRHTHTHTRTRTYMYLYIYMYTQYICTGVKTFRKRLFSRKRNKLPDPSSILYTFTESK